ncbi:MAG: alcohol dehydrogenase catalytic domain-containing protein [Acidimicrobiales bacterium]
MKAMVFTRPGVVEVQDVPEAVGTDDEVIIDIDRAGICGSELHGIQTPGFRVPPLIMGHEFVGHTADGRRVAINPLVSCGTCDLCVAGTTQLCRSRSLLGIHVAGGFAERVAVPASSIHELPNELDLDRAGLIEPIANAVHAWALAGAPRAKRIGIIGCGPIGLACLEVARHYGAASIACTDLSGDRRDVALKIGANEVSETLEGEFDVIFDAVGTPGTRRASVDRLIPGGTTVWLGLATADAGFDAAHAVRMEKNIRGSFAYTDAQFAEAVAIAPRLDLSWSTTFPLSEGADIFNALMAGQSLPIKALLRP